MAFLRGVIRFERCYLVEDWCTLKQCTSEQSFKKHGSNMAWNLSAVVSVTICLHIFRGFGSRGKLRPKNTAIIPNVDIFYPEISDMKPQWKELAFCVSGTRYVLFKGKSFSYMHKRSFAGLEESSSMWRVKSPRIPTFSSFIIHFWVKILKTFKWK